MGRASGGPDTPQMRRKYIPDFLRTKSAKVSTMDRTRATKPNPAGFFSFPKLRLEASDRFPQFVKTLMHLAH